MKSEKFTPITPTEEQRAYEELAKKEASNSNSVFDKIASSITGKGFDKEDIMRVDANTENEFRDKIKNNKYRGYYVDAKEKLEKIKNTTLGFSRTGTGEGVNDNLSGRINGHNVIVNEYTRKGMSDSEYFGTIDGLELSENEARLIFGEYIDTALNRKEEIYSAKHRPEIEKQNIIKKEKEESEAKAKEEATAKANAKAKVDEETKAKTDEEKALLLKDIGFHKFLNK